MRPFLAIALTEARQLGWMALVPCTALAGLFAGLVFVQEPPELAVIGLDFAWESLQAMLVSIAVVLPLVSLLLREPGGLAWERRASPSPAWDAVAWSTGILVAGGMVLGAMLTAIITVERITGRQPSWGLAAVAWSGSSLALLPLAAIAPAVGSVLRAVPALLLGWLSLLAASAGAFGPSLPSPLDRVLAPGPGLGAGALAAVTLSTFAGLILSTATARRRFSECRGHSPAAERAPRW